MHRHNAMAKQNRQQDHQADSGADEYQLVQRITAAQHLDHGIHDRDAKHGKQQISDCF